MNKLFKKGPFTTAIGILIIIGVAVKIWFEKGMSTEDAISLMVALGLIGAKDRNQSHTKDIPPEDKDEKP